MLQVISRHPGRKIKISKVSYEEESADGLSVEEIVALVEKEILDLAVLQEG